jgi:1-acyl-sn-glycerol-3-phosphate acyltransferase
MWWPIVITAGLAIAILWRWRWYEIDWYSYLILFGARIYSRLLHRWGSNCWMAPFPQTGPFLVISNHTCSADPAFLLAACKRPMSFLVAREHYDVHYLISNLLNHLGCIKVARGRPDPVALRQAIRRLQEGMPVCLFPEGGLSGVAKNRMVHAKPGIAFLALVTRAPVYPLYISGGPHTEQLLNSWVLPTPKAVHVTFGKPIDLCAYYGRPLTRKLIEEVNGVIMDHVRALRPGETGKTNDER